MRSEFGELFKSALQIWRAFQISSPNLVAISLPKNSPHRLLTDSQQSGSLIPDRLTSNPKTVYEIYWMMTPGLNFEFCPDQLSIFGY